MDEEKIVNLNEVVKRIAVLSDVDEETSREFMQAFCKVLVDTLLSKDSVDIRAIGRFSEDEHQPGNVRFEASLPLASVVNRPFSCFDPIELDDEADIPQEISSDVEILADSVCEESVKKVTSVDMSDLPEEVVVDAESEEQLPLPCQEHSDTEGIQENVHAEELIADGKEVIDPSEIKSIENEPEQIEPATVRIDDRKPLQVEIVGGEDEKRHHPLTRWIFSLGLVIGLCAGFIAGILLYDYIYPVSQRNIIADDIDDTDIIVIEDDTAVDSVSGMISGDSVMSQSGNVDKMNALSDVAEPVKEPVRESVGKVVTDTISAGHFLATMARKHYGSYVFWVYIYEENKDKISDPDNVATGTVLVIPDASKYGIDAGSAESVKKAKAKATEIANSRRRGV